MRIGFGLVWLVSFVPRIVAGQEPEFPILLTADKAAYLEDDLRVFSGATFVPRGERVVLRAVMDWPYKWDIDGCPRLLLRRDVNGHCRASENFPGRVEIKFDAGHVNYWSGLGDYRFRVAMPNGPESNELVIRMADAAKIERTWGPTENGVTIDLELDKETFAAGEDVPLHVALKNFEASVPIYGQSPIWHPYAAVKIEVREANGQYVQPHCPRPFMDGGPMGLSRFPKGMIVPLEYSLDDMGFLPDHDGTFTVWATWRTYQGTDDACHMCEAPDGFDAEKPYAVVRSQVKTFRVVSGGKTFSGCW